MVVDTDVVSYIYKSDFNYLPGLTIITEA